MNVIHKITYYDEATFRYITEYRNNHGQLHREIGPAIEYSDGDYEWYMDGRLHNLNGYARCLKNAQTTYLEYYVYGKRYNSIEDYYNFVHKNNKIKVKQNIRKVKFKKILQLLTTLTITNIYNINSEDKSIIDNNKIEQITKKYNDYLEIWDITTEEYKSIQVVELSINNHYIHYNNNKYKILNMISHDE